MLSDNTLGQAKHCGHVDDEGEFCRGTPTSDGFCPMHSPLLADKMAVARRQGGKMRAYPDLPDGRKPGPPKTIQDLRDGLALAIEQAWRQGNTAERGRLIAQLSKELRETFVASDLEDRLAQLEARNGKR